MSILRENPHYVSLCRLREDAIRRGLADLALVYGWSILRITEATIVEQLRALHK